MYILQNATADGSGRWMKSQGGPVFFETQGTFDGATVALEITRNDGITVHEVTTLSAVDVVLVDLPSCELRATVSGAGGSTNVTVRL